MEESHANVQALIQCLAQDGNLDAVVVDELNTASGPFSVVQIESKHLVHKS